MSFGLQRSRLRSPWDTTCALQPQMQTLCLDGAVCSRAQNLELGRWTGRQESTQTHSLDTSWVCRTKDWSSLISATPVLISGQLVSQTLPFLVFSFRFSTIKMACSCIYIGNYFQTHDRHRESVCTEILCLSSSDHCRRMYFLSLNCNVFYHVLLMM